MKNSQEFDMQNINKFCILFGTSAFSCLLIIGITVGLTTFKKSDATPDNLTIFHIPQNWNDWNNIAYFYGKENIQITDINTIQVKYPQGSYQNTGGFKFYSQPDGFPTNKACLEYSLKFINNFQWVKGGKLPGMWIGSIGANGGNHIDNGFSARFMWRTAGDAEVYLYIPNNQIKEYYTQIISNNNYGESLWRGIFKFQQNIWNNLRLCITLNSPNTYDGIIEAQVNDITMTFKKIMWTHNQTLKINGIMMTTFYGGNDPTWASQNTTYTYFRNFTVIT